MPDLVIKFFYIIVLLVKFPTAKRVTAWHIRYFTKAVKSLTDDGLRAQGETMLAEIAICQKRRRSRVHMYNMSDLDSVCTQYYINPSQAALDRAWYLFNTENYRTEKFGLLLGA